MSDDVVEAVAVGGAREHPRAMAATAFIVALFLVLGFLLEPAVDVIDPAAARQLDIVWDEPVMLLRHPDCVDEGNGQLHPEGAIGYEPGIAVDSNGVLYYTAHKDLRWSSPDGGIANPLSGQIHVFPDGACLQNYMTSWDYYASWFFVSRDGGATWEYPAGWQPTTGNPGSFASACVGDEGDIGVDGNDVVYFVDTTLEDNWLHVWEDGGQTHLRCQRQSSLAADDRPWITAHGDGIVHYLGNSGITIPGPNGDSGRYWYYRSDDGGLTWSEEKELPGGWAHIDASPDSEHVYIVQEEPSDGGTVKIWVSDDWGVSWSESMTIGPLAGTHSEGYPWVSAGWNGQVAAVWQESPQGGRAPGTVHIAMSWDHGETWENWTITPFDAVFLYPNVDIGPDGTVAIAFCANVGDDPTGAHAAGDEWMLYAAMQADVEVGDQWAFTMADPDPLYVSKASDIDPEDLHPLHDFFEITISPVDGSLVIAYQHNIGEHPFEDGEEQRYLFSVRGAPA